jgi:dihydroorotase
MSAALRLRRPDDWHLHLRDGPALRAVLPCTAARFARAIVMPNLQPGDHDRPRARLPSVSAPLIGGQHLPALMTSLLTDQTQRLETVARASGRRAAPYPPAPPPTPMPESPTSAASMPRAAMAEVACHCWSAKGRRPVSMFDRESRFIDDVLVPLRQRLPRLRIVFEHVTTRAAVAFVRAQADNVGATITPQHLALNRNALFVGGIRPHNYCLPVLKRESDRIALLDAVAGGDPRFFLAPTARPMAAPPERACGCAESSAHAA